MSPSAKAGKQFFVNSQPHVIIDENIYTFASGESLGTILMAALETHIENNRSFPNWITFIDENKESEKFFTPALLCGFNYMSVSEFMEAALDGVLDEREEDEHDI